MPDTHCTLNILGVEVPVTVTWCVGRCEREYVLEVEQVTSDVLGDITSKVLNNLCGDGFWCRSVPVPTSWPKTTAWVPYDPMQAVVFGQPHIYRRGDDRIRSEAQPYDHPVKWGSDGGLMRGAMVQHERMETRLVAHGTMEHRLCDHIMYTDQWWDAVSDYEAWLSEVD